MESGYPFYALVPKGLRENLAFRRKLIKWGALSRENAQTLWIMCARDVLFYINTFLFTINQRVKGKKLPVKPFVTYDYQDKTIESIEGILGERDYLIEKSRDMGASWICLALFEHQWHFYQMRNFLCVSSKSDLVDMRGNPDSMFWKIEFILKNMPGWLRPNYDHNAMIFRNRDNMSTINGESTQRYAGTGGRSTAILLDEFSKVDEDIAVLASTRDNTDCRIFNSTPNYRGTNCAFYDVAQKMPDAQKTRLHWTMHPDKAKGLYYDGAGKARSPWYDLQCERAHSKMEIAIELDIDYKGAESGFFDQDLIEHLKAESAPALAHGELVFDEGVKAPRFIKVASGSWRLWDTPDDEGKWPEGEGYAIGADISYGKGATNSTISVVNKRTGRKVASCANPHIEPHKWAEVFVAACRWFNNAYGIWEANGPGRIFGDNVVELGYRNFYYRQKEQRLSRDSTEIYGWQNNQGSLITLFGDYQKALRTGAFKNPCRDALQECLQYSFNKMGSIQHGGAMTANDPSGARENHGDMVVADALALKGMTELPFYAEAPVEKEFPELSLGWRNKIRDQRRRAETSGIVWVAAHA